jgi:hypothetical protein
MMRRTLRQGAGAAIAAIGVMLATMGPIVSAQKVTPADLAARFSGTWKLNRDLTTSFSEASSRGGRPGGASPSRAVAPLAGLLQPQRGGRSGGGAPAGNPEDRANEAALASMQQIADTVKIAATADSVTFTDPRGERSFTLNNKEQKLQLNGGTISSKSKWDKSTLHQEFLFGERKITHFWDLNPEGTQLTLKIRMEDFSRIGPFKESKAVYDKAQ